MSGMVDKSAMKSAYSAGVREGERRAQSEANRRAWPIIMQFARERQAAYQRTYFGWAAMLSGALVAFFSVITIIQPDSKPSVFGASIVVMLLGIFAIAFGIGYRNREIELLKKRVQAHEERWRDVIDFMPDLGVMRMHLAAGEAANANPAPANQNDGVEDGQDTPPT
ncbi:MAG: hypothetical protein AAFP79_04875 [Pseudomonadota bacterium]